jgi:hypothetical protein
MTTSLFKKQTPPGGQQGSAVNSNWFVFFDEKGNPVTCVSQIGLWSAFFQASAVNDKKTAGESIDRTESLSAVDNRVMQLLSPFTRNVIDEFCHRVETASLPELLLMALVDNELKNVLRMHIKRSHWKKVIKNRGKTMRRYWRSLNSKTHPLEALLDQHLKPPEIKVLAEEQPEFVIGVLLKLSKLNSEVFSRLILRLQPTEILVDLTYRNEDLHRAILECEDAELLERWSWESAELGPVVDTIHPFNRLAGNTLFIPIYETFKATNDIFRYGCQLEGILRFQKFDIFRELLTVKLGNIVECMECNIALPSQDIQKVIELADQATRLFATLGRLLAAETHVHLVKYFSMQGDNEKASQHKAKVRTHLLFAKNLELSLLSRQVMSAWCRTTDLSVAFKLKYIQLLITDIPFKNWEQFMAETQMHLEITSVHGCR